MTDTYPAASPNAFPSDDDSDRSTKDVVAEQAGAVKDEAVAGSERVLETAKDSAADVVDEAKSQGADLLRETQAELREQAAIQQQRVANGLHALSRQLGEMARSSSGGLAADLVSGAAARTGSVASYLDARDPGSLINELKSYAARRPGAFIAMAVAAGAVAGRLTRSLASGASETTEESSTGLPAGQSPVRPPETRTPSIQNASATAVRTADRSGHAIVLSAPHRSHGRRRGHQRHLRPGCHPMTDIPTPSEQKAADTSLGDLLGEVTRDMSTLMRQELELAKAELRESATRAGKGAGLLGGAGYAALMGILFISIAAWWGLGYLVGNAWSGLIVAAIWLIVGVVLYFQGRAAIKSIRGTPQTVDTLKEIPETLKRNEENR